MEETTKKKYEISFLLKTEESLSEVFAILERYGAEIEKKENLLKKIALAYRIKKYKEAFFGFVIFMAEPKDISLISKELNLNNEILRSLIVIPLKIEEKPEKTTEEKKANPETPAVALKKEEPEISPEKVSALSNEALEKKLEEILG